MVIDFTIFKKVCMFIGCNIYLKIVIGELLVIEEFCMHGSMKDCLISNRYPSVNELHEISEKIGEIEKTETG